MSFAFWILGVDLVALGAVWLMCRGAPFGYQDREGFHHGIPPETKSSESDRPDLLTRRASSVFDRFSGHCFGGIG